MNHVPSSTGNLKNLVNNIPPTCWGVKCGEQLLAQVATQVSRIFIDDTTVGCLTHDCKYIDHGCTGCNDGSVPSLNRHSAAVPVQICIFCASAIIKGNAKVAVHAAIQHLVKYHIKLTSLLSEVKLPEC